jgi:4-amino-4-deoxy-L-arabinose transferase-like glycosyltransferase
MSGLGLQSPSARARWLLAALVLATLALRLGFLVWGHSTDPGRMVAVDTSSYENTARALAAHGRFAEHPDRPERPNLVRPPGYPLFLYAVYGLGGGRLAAAAVQVVLGAAVVGMVFWLGLRLGGEAAACAAAALFALDPSSFLYTQLLLSEALFTFLLVCFAVCAVELWGGRGRAWPWALAAGAALAAATLVRPLTYYLLPAAGLVVLAGQSGRRGWCAAAGLMVLFLLPGALSVGAWQWRNYRQSGYLRYSHIEGINLAKYWAAEVLAEKRGISREEAERLFLARLDAEAEPGWSRARRWDLYARRSLEMLKDNPWLALRGAGEGLLGFLLVPGIPDLMAYLRLEPPATGPTGDLIRLGPGSYLERWAAGRPGLLAAHALNWAYLLAVYAGAALAAWALIRRRPPPGWAHAMLWLAVVYLVAVSSQPGSYARLRMPVMPLLCLYAGWGWAWAWRARRGR